MDDLIRKLILENKECQEILRWMLSDCDEHDVFWDCFGRRWGYSHGECVYCEKELRDVEKRIL